jgi:WD40 repeat protein
MNASPNLAAFQSAGPSHSYQYIEGTDEVEAVGDEGNNDHDILDIEEGGAPLNDIDMEQIIDQPPIAPLQSAPLQPDTPDISIGVEAPPVEQVATLGPLTELGAVIPAHPQHELHQDEDEAFDPDAPDFLMDGQDPHPPFLTNTNPGLLSPDNHNSYNFLRTWRWLKARGQLKDIGGIPHNVSSILKADRPKIKFEELKGDECDLQGINWRFMGVTRSWARKYRLATFRNYTNRPHSDAWDTSVPDKLLTRHENYFRFRSMDLRPDVCLLHFQLRNILGCASRTRVFYPSTSSTVRELDPTTGHVRTAMRFKSDNDSSVSTLAAEEGILMTGSFYGTYRYRHIDAEDKLRCSEGLLTKHPSGITNHVQISPTRRSSAPLAAFASNDYGFRIVDLARNQMVFDKMYDFALNCSALNPDKTLRVMVGDTQNVTITDAETGEILQSLEGHRDYGFACDWAPDGWTVATGNQDKSIRIWDARKWKNSKGESISVAVIRTEMAGVRNLRFSPLGSGKRLLLAPEEADIINIIDAQTFNSKQTIDIFGELAGVSFASAGQEIIALSSDPIRGGVLCLERSDHGAEDTFNYSPRRYSRNRWRTSGYDWLPTPQEVVDYPDSQATLTQKRRQATMTENWFF